MGAYQNAEPTGINELDAMQVDEQIAVARLQRGDQNRTYIGNRRRREPPGQ